MQLLFRDFKYYITNSHAQELEAITHLLSWYKRTGSLKDLKPGDIVKVKFGAKFRVNTFAQVTGVRDKQIDIQWADGTRRAIFLFHLERQERETLVLKDDHGIYFYYGFLRLLRQRLPHLQFTCGNEYSGLVTPIKIDPKILPGIELYDWQQAAANKILSLKRGLCTMPTNSGKGEVILAVLRHLMNHGLLIKGTVAVPTTMLAEQMVLRAKEEYGFTDDEVGVFHGTQKDFGPKILFAVVDSIAIAMKDKTSKSLLLQHLKESNVMLIDESHHVRSDKHSAVLLENTHVEYLACLSGSPFLYEDPLIDMGDAIVYGITGGPVFTMGYDIMIKRGVAAQPHIFFKKIGGTPLKTRQTYTKVYDEQIVKNEQRNKIIVEYIRLLHKFGYQTLILVQRMEHAELLMDAVSNLQPLLLSGGQRGVYYSDIEERVEFKVNFKRVKEQIADKTWRIIFGTPVLDEGVDVPSIGAVINAGGGKSRIKILQRLGRGLRRKKRGINQVFLLDFEDVTHVFFGSHNKARRELYKLACANVLKSEEEFNDMIYRGQDDNDKPG